MTDRQRLITLLRQNATRTRRTALTAKRLDVRLRNQGRADAYATALELAQTLTRRDSDDRTDR